MDLAGSHAAMCVSWLQLNPCRNPPFGQHLNAVAVQITGTVDALPKKWKIKPLINLTENEVYKNLAESKIFLAFSELEGLPLPPVEAAISGNKVIGYTGEGGKEYWKKPIFTEVKSSEIKNFCKIILSNLNLENFLKKSYSQRKKLSNMFSPKEEHNAITKFLKKI